MSLLFDDPLETALGADLSTPQGVESAWRQLTELIGNRRVRPVARAMRTLRRIWDQVPEAIRVEGALGLERARLPAPLVRLFAIDVPAVAFPVLRGAQLSASEWTALLPELAPEARAVLQQREDLDPGVRQMLVSAGSAGLAVARLGAGEARAEAATVSLVFAEPVSGASLATPADGHVATGHAEAILATEQDLAQAVSASMVDEGVRPAIVVEIDGPAETGTLSSSREPEAVALRPRPAIQFRFETDETGLIRWVEGANRGALIGLGLDSRAMDEGSRVDASAGGAFRQRADIANSRMRISGESDAAGDWLLSAVPIFDAATGRFAGYRGTARRPRADERADAGAARTASADSLRQLVHELRTPTNAIAGFAEMIETQMLGAVPAAYRDRARTIRARARELLGAIDDLDLAARIDSAALALVPGAVRLQPLFEAIGEDLAVLAELRETAVALPEEDQAVIGDRRAIERLLSRLIATLVSASGPGERVGVRMLPERDSMIAIVLDRPRALAEYPGDSVLGIDDEREDTSLLGTGFALRLARNLARELGGSLVIEATTLTLRLRAAVTSPIGHAHLS